ncbi:endoplasmic reticulum metallopeptidase 1-like isoform X2 [Aricia agestis]|uniref:endoplasmic reticulum metallopeptidase 1-like isoform X2 n=1 Tax=Aricia agestis TaxID=91739 RepID=UPI001C202449|nr:endoplasmic reticulum metallopeptidase 1-like isoform X2 [Aricia agestis]XP_041971480.1 endoplasmic reticulum metallopeptidase 1-like isoform X2 [Aricia agestis]
MSMKVKYTPALPLEINDHEEKSSLRVPSPFILLLLGFYIGLAFFAQYMEDRMPAVVKKYDVSRLESDIFSEEKANEYLHQIIGDQPRVAGTVDHFVKTRDVKTMVDTIATDSNTPVHTDWQYANGDYWLAFSSPHVNCYQNLSNIIAVLEGESGFRADGSTGTSILVNCHIDSVPYAIGASDNGLFCGAMAEILYKFSRRKKKFKHNIIFLFNGSEETPLQASHAFLSHPWAEGVVSVVNLDSAGMNGLPNVFQVTDPRILRSYVRSSARPSAQSLGEAMFRAGVIPSDTDFRIFRDFGNMQGLDMAFVKWGNVYHTRNDEPSLILPGVMQNAGNTLLGLLRELADQEELADKLESPTPMVYYDYLTLFMLSYSLGAAHAVDALVAVLGTASVLYYLWIVGLRRSSINELLLSVISRVASALAGCAAVALCTLIMVNTTTQLRYLSRPWLVAPLYWMPFVIAAVAASHAFDAWRTRKCGLNRLKRVAQAMAATRLLITLALVVLLVFPSTAPVRYILSVPLTVMSLGALISLSVLRWFRPAAWQHLLLEAVISVPSVLLLLSQAVRLSALLLPVAGRSGAACPDCTIAVVSAALALLALAVPCGIELVFSRRYLWVVLGAASAACVALMFVPFDPYAPGGYATQRHYWFHTKITSFDEDMKVIDSRSGILVTKVDALGVHAAGDAIQTYNRSLHISRVTAEDCEKAVYCDVPLYRPRFDIYLSDSIFVDFPPPEEFQHELREEGRLCDANTCTIHYVLNGPAHNTITITPRAGVNLTSWTFNSPLRATRTHRDRPVYVIVHAIGTVSEFLPTLEFQLTFDVSLPRKSVIAEISHHAHKIFSPEEFTPQYQRLLDAMPQYFNIASFITFKNNYLVSSS